jgi:hypothetical protein
MRWFAPRRRHAADGLCSCPYHDQCSDLVASPDDVLMRPVVAEVSPQQAADAAEETAISLYRAMYGRPGSSVA